MGLPLYSLGRHTVNAAEVAAIGNGNPEIVQDPAERIV